MTDAKATLSEVQTSGTPHGNVNDKEKTDLHKPSAVTRAESKTSGSTPTRPRSALNARLANSTPRVRPRPAPVRSLSSPLARSLSVRVSKKDGRWSERHTEPNSPISTTYKDDFQPPENLSYKLRSLNLETSFGTSSAGSDGDPSPFTTYRDSFQWPKEQPAPSPRPLPPGTGKRDSVEQRGDVRHAGDTPKVGGAKPSVTATSDHKERVSTLHQATLSSSAKTVSRNSEVPHNSHDRGSDLSSILSPTADTTARESRSQRSDSSPGKDSGNWESQSFVSASRKSSESSNDDSASSKPTSERGTGPTNGTAVLSNGIEGAGAFNTDSAGRTPRRFRAYQLQSSTDGSPFAYGSESGSWV